MSRQKKRPTKAFNSKKILLIAFSVPILSSLISAAIVVFNHSEHTLSRPKYLAVVPGAGITRSGKPSPALRWRLQKADSLYREHKVKKIFISGKSYEIFSMSRYLLSKGVDRKDIIEDIHGKNTFQTVKNVRTYCRRYGIRSVVFISQHYHLPRIRLLAHRLKVPGAVTVAANTNTPRFKTHSRFILRETFALQKAWLFDR